MLFVLRWGAGLLLLVLALHSAVTQAPFDLAAAPAALRWALAGGWGAWRSLVRGYLKAALVLGPACLLVTFGEKLSEGPQARAEALSSLKALVTTPGPARFVGALALCLWALKFYPGPLVAPLCVYFGALAATALKAFAAVRLNLNCGFSAKTPIARLKRALGLLSCSGGRTRFLPFSLVWVTHLPLV